jgi:hypothetical protein
MAIAVLVYTSATGKSDPGDKITSVCLIRNFVSLAVKVLAVTHAASNFVCKINECEKDS